jgi:hypothetical protein
MALLTLALVFPRVNGAQAVLGLCSGFAGNAALAWLAPDVSWLWWNLAGFGLAFFLPLALAYLQKNFPRSAWLGGDSSVWVGAFTLALLVLAVTL